MVDAVDRARAVATRPAVARLLVVVVLGALVWGSVSAFRSLPDAQRIEWVPLAVVSLVATPIGVLLNACEYRLSASAISIQQSWSRSARISVYGTAANLLPIPGASLVRIDALRQARASYADATLTTLAVGLVWLGTSLWMAAAMSAPSETMLALAFFVAGAAPVAIALRVFGRLGASLRVVAGIVWVQVGLVTMQAVRLYVAIDAIGADASITQSFALGVSVTVAAAAGFLPGGLGIREALATALGPIVGLTAAEAFLATLLDRVAGLGAMALVAAIVLIATRGRVDRLVDEVTTDGSNAADQ